jgi:hypothetical protein
MNFLKRKEKRRSLLRNSQFHYHGNMKIRNYLNDLQQTRKFIGNHGVSPSLKKVPFRGDSLFIEKLAMKRSIL